ncbi:nucleotide exchange factor GrpE [Leucobacter chromiiresistens]|uniref:Protein GrpE n=1 Tax=Leucobacter chromiiresistens TaxID=1079994 RepID=A0A147EC02_9MICO|nr:nucleotide exchange factor GrpE [Leucobacter chromiiresistens]KTR81699.1 molecular chaperone GrpE [Leucobacter chromiiresistens]
MANEEQRTPGEDPNADEVPAQEPESQDSGSAPQPDLTVEDILEAEQSDAAADADSAEAGAAADADNPYLDDLRRLTAEYANYRKRTEANAAIEKQRAIAAAVSPMLTVLDDLDRAEKHGDLAEGSAFATIAQKIRGTFERIGVQSFGETGEVFDPQIHEAIAQVPVPGTEQQTVLDVIERGYRIGEVELRPAKVAVAVGADG